MKSNAYQWLPQELRPYKPLYKGRRYWVFLNQQDKPFDEWTKDYEVVAYDIDIGAIMAVGNYTSDGKIDASYMGGQGVRFFATTPRGIIDECLQIMRSYC